MENGTDLTYEALDMVVPLRSGLRRLDWRHHADAVRKVSVLGGDDHAMAGAMGVTRKHMLDYASKVPSFADVLHDCLNDARKGTFRSWSTTWAWKKTASMARDRKKPVSTYLPSIGVDPHTRSVRHDDAMTDPAVAAPRAQARQGFSNSNEEPGSAKLITSAEPFRETESAPRPRELRSEDWREHADEVIRIGKSGGDDYSMAAQLQVSRNMLLQYARAVPEFNEALMYARTCARAWWESAMRLAIKKRSGLNAKMVIAGHSWITRTDDTGQPIEPPRFRHVRRKRKQTRKQRQ